MKSRCLLFALILAAGLAPCARAADSDEGAQALLDQVDAITRKLGDPRPAPAPAPVAAPGAPSTAWKEVVEPGEAELFAGFAKEIQAQQQEAAQGGPLRRGFHAKLHAGIAAEFRVLDGLPAHARVGLFATAKTFPCVVRFSNGSPTLQPDGRPDPRGIGVKVIGAPGRKLLPGLEDAVTQDFLATSHSVTSTVRSAKQFMAFIHAAKNKLTLPITLARELGVWESARILKAFAGTVLLSKVHSMATEHFSSTAPIKFGALAGKFAIQPSAGTPEAAKRPKSDDSLHDELADRLRAGDVVLDFVVQFYVDDQRTPIEDTSVAWDPAVAPCVKVAQIVIHKCDLDLPAAKAFSQAVDHLSFSPWHATEDHRPLGNIMRARRVAYAASTSLRGVAGEPARLEDVAPAR